MSKTKQDYEAIGAELFNNGKARPEGNSWQAKAMQCGFDCAQTDRHDAFWDDVSNMAREDQEADNRATDDSFTWEKDVVLALHRVVIPLTHKQHIIYEHTLSRRGPVQEHINCLRYASTLSTNKREMRLKSKIAKLEKKWGIA